MKRILLLICALFLMLDLAADGRLGKVKFVSPKTPVNSSLTSSHQSITGKVASQDEPPLTDRWATPGHFQGRQTTLPVSLALKNIDHCHFNSSGGVPL